MKLQALVRGHNVRKQAKLTLQCMQALIRAQNRVRTDHQRARLSHEGGRRSMFAETNSLWESKYLHDIRDRKSMVSSLIIFLITAYPYEQVIIEVLFLEYLSDLTV